MTSTAAKSEDLRRRVIRFLDREYDRDPALVALLNSLKSSNQVYIFGGLVRDIALNGITSKKSDIDLVFTGSKLNIESAVSDYEVNVNKFGGYRLNTKHWQVDIWKASESWAFRNTHCTYKNIESLLDTTITNWDSILFDLQTKRVIARNSYFSEITRGYLDLVLSQNPNKIGMNVKLFRALSDYRVRSVSLAVSSEVREALKAFGLDQILDYERNHYKSSRIDPLVIEQLQFQCENNESDLLPVEISQVSKNLLLFANSEL